MFCFRSNLGIPKKIHRKSDEYCMRPLLTVVITEVSCLFAISYLRHSSSVDPTLYQVEDIVFCKAFILGDVLSCKESDIS